MDITKCFSVFALYLDCNDQGGNSLMLYNKTTRRKEHRLCSKIIIVLRLRHDHSRHITKAKQGIPYIAGFRIG